MSRNKTIKLLHDVTLKSYAECRAALKRNHWDFVTTYYYMNGGIDLNEFSKTFANFAENLAQAMAAACEGLAHCFAGVAESLRHYNATMAAADAARVEAIPTKGLLPAQDMRAQLGIEPVEVSAPIVSFDGVVDDDGTIHGAFNDGETI